MNLAKLCPHCKTKSKFDTITYSGSQYNGHFILQCQNCDEIIYLLTKENKEYFVYPFVGIDPPFVVNDSFDKSYKEGIACLNVGAPLSAVAMFRRCSQIISEDKGAKDNVLYDKVNSLIEVGTLKGMFEEIADIIREVGNDGAHPNKFEPSLQDAKDVLGFLNLLIENLYVYPAKLEELKKRRED